MATVRLAKTSATTWLARARSRTARVGYRAGATAMRFVTPAARVDQIRRSVVPSGVVARPPAARFAPTRRVVRVMTSAAASEEDGETYKSPPPELAQFVG